MPLLHPKTQIVEVALHLGKQLSTLSYLPPRSEMATASLLGKRVQVQVGKRKATGIVTRHGEGPLPEGFKLKPIDFVVDDKPVLTASQLQLAHFVSDYYESSFFDALRLCLPKQAKVVDAKVFVASDAFLAKLKLLGHKSKSKRVRRSQLQGYGYDDAAISMLIQEAEIAIEEGTLKALAFDTLGAETTRECTLNAAQQSATDAILKEGGRAFLLEGVTGSGKTEVYLAAAKAVLAQQKSVLFIVPEIGLTPQLIERIRLRLDEEPAVIHSYMSPNERDRSMERIRRAEARVIVGARSALFSPVQDLGLIVVDEEHDGGFKQEESPRYHARDVALWLAHHEGARIVLGSATPSLESQLNVKRGRLQHLVLHERALATATMPNVEVIDLRERRLHDISRLKDRSASHGPDLCILSSPLRTAIAETLAKKQQVILFLNRRGYANYLICESCGHIAYCPHCSISLTYHKGSHQLLCHQCSFSRAFNPKCLQCTDGVLTPLGLGTERVEKEVQLSFPDVVVARFDRESTKNAHSLQKTLQRLHKGEIDILIGTQMIAKGHDFPLVTLVGVILADSGLGLADFRAGERAFQLLTQVAGRAGRRETQGRVLIQTYNPEHPAIVNARNHDVEGFSARELEERQAFFYPPFARAALLRIEAQNEEDTASRAGRVREVLDACLASSPYQNDVVILGPAPCQNLKLRNYFRWQLFIKAKSVAARKFLLAALRSNEPLNRELVSKKGRMIIDVDPTQLL